MGGFHPLAVVNTAAVNMVCKHLYVSLFSLLLGQCPGVDLPGHVVVLCFIEEPPCCFPQQLSHFTSPPTPISPHPHQHLFPFLFCLFSNHPDGCEVVAYVFLNSFLWQPPGHNWKEVCA